MTKSSGQPVILVAYHGLIGGGEIMTLAVARTLRALGVSCLLVAPAYPADLTSAAKNECIRTSTFVNHKVSRFLTFVAIRRSAARARGARGCLLWCHGLGPAVATIGLSERVVHLHRVPDARQIPLVWLASLGSVDIVVPSRDTWSRLPRFMRARTHVLENWGSSSALGTHLPRVTGSPIHIGFLGRLAPGKGITDLALAVRRLLSTNPGLDIALKVAGEPHFVGSSDRVTVERALGLVGGRVQRLGWVDRHDFLRDVDVLVCPSRWPESFGLVVAEAMAAGVPVVVTDAGALPEVVGEAHPYIARAGDVADLSRVLNRAVGDLGTAYGHSVIAAQRRRWVEHWSPEAGVDRVTAALSRWGVHV